MRYRNANISDTVPQDGIIGLLATDNTRMTEDHQITPLSMSLNYFKGYSSHVKSESAPTYLEECALLEERERERERDYCCIHRLKLVALGEIKLK